MGWRLLGTIAAGMVGLGAPACSVGQFTCQSDAQCMAEGQGLCQPAGYCSFPAADCPSGQRFGEHSGPQAGQCVGEDGEAASTGGLGSTSSGEPPAPDDGPALDSGLPMSEAEAEATGPGTGPAMSTGPDIVTTGEDDAPSESSGTGEELDPDLVLWLALDRAPLGDVLDSSSFMANGHCEPPGCPGATPGVLDGAVWFDGVDDVIAVPPSLWLDTPDAFTLAAFVRVEDASADFQALFGKTLGDSIENSWELYFEAQTLYLAMATSIDYYAVTLPWEYPSDQWVHLAGTWDGDLLMLFVDGQLEGIVESPGIELDDHPVLVGADDDHAAELVGHFLGSVDDVRVYRRALTIEEIGALASP